MPYEFKDKSGNVICQIDFQEADNKQPEIESTEDFIYTYVFQSEDTRTVLIHAPTPHRPDKYSLIAWTSLNAAKIVVMDDLAILETAPIHSIEFESTKTFLVDSHPQLIKICKSDLIALRADATLDLPAKADFNPVDFPRYSMIRIDADVTPWVAYDFGSAARRILNKRQRPKPRK